MLGELQAFIDLIRDFLSSDGPLALRVFVASSLAAFAVLWLAMSGKGSAEGLVRWIRGGAWGATYQSWVIRLLATTDRWFLTREQFEDVRPETWYSPARSWSVKLYDRCLLLAVLYPMTSLLLQWALVEWQTYLDEKRMLFPIDDWEARYAVIGGLAVSIACSAIAATRSSWLFCIFWGGMSMVGAGASIVMDMDAGSAAFPLAIALIVASFLGRQTKGALAVVLTVLGVFGGGLVSIFSLLIEGNIWIILSFACMAWLTIMLILGAITAWLIRFFGISPATYFGLTILTLTAILVQIRIADDRAIILIFLGLLPLLNAMFDFGSIGLTRWALRRGTAGTEIGIGTVLWSLLDFAAALILFLALGCVGIAVIETVNVVAGRQTIDLSELFEGIQDPSKAYWWLYFTFASTLLPTLIHLMLASVAFGPAILGPRTRGMFAGLLNPAREHRLEQLLGLAILSVWCGLVIAVPVTLGTALWDFALGEHWLKDTLLAFFRWFHALIS